MKWRKLRYVIVENEKGKLDGLISSGSLIGHFSDNYDYKKVDDKLVGDIMVKEPITVRAETPILEAIQIMEKNEIGCLPVVNSGNIVVGMITEINFLKISSRLLKRLKEEEKEEEKEGK